MYKISLYDFCRQNERDYLLEQWDTERNGAISPNNTAKTSVRIVWWRCENGHRWETQVRSRLNGSGCPYCYLEKQKEKRQRKQKRGKIL